MDSLNNHQGQDWKYRKEIQLKLKERLEDALKLTSQCLIVRLVVKYPLEVQALPDNSCFQYFMEEYRREVKYKLIHYVWVREQAYSHNQHYHVVLIFDGNVIRYFKHRYLPLDIWSKALEKFHHITTSATGLIHICKDPRYQGIQLDRGNMVRRDNIDLQQEVLHQNYYIAKTYSKGSAPKHVREYGCSYLKTK